MIVKMKKEDFKVGDRVEINGLWEEYEGIKGTVFSLEFSLETNNDVITILLDEPCDMSWNDEEIGITDERGLYVDCKYLTKIEDNKSSNTKGQKEDLVNCNLTWSNDMISEKIETPKESNLKIKVNIDNEGFTTVKIKNKGKNNIYDKFGTAQWNEKVDKYDSKIGVLIATARALGFNKGTVNKVIEACFLEEDNVDTKSEL